MTTKPEPHKRGTAVKFTGFRQESTGRDFKTLNKTYVWAWLEFPDLIRYVIEHPDGFEKQEFLNPQFGKEVVDYLSKNLADGKKFIFCTDQDIEPFEQPPATQQPPPNLENLHNT